MEKTDDIEMCKMHLQVTEDLAVHQFAATS